MSQAITLLSDSEFAFPHPNLALSDPNGLLAVGGDLSVKRVVNAYRQGIFPWYGDGDPIMWWSPDPRAIIALDDVRINRSLAKFLKKCPYQVSVNHAFKQVIDLCADAPFRQDDTWIIDDMINAYQQLHQAGFAHSIEVWHEQQLVGGLYGVAINGFFSGESMFYRKANASKVALVYLAELLKNQQVPIIDCQLQNPFLASMGAIEISRENFIKIKQQAININIDPSIWQPRELTL